MFASDGISNFLLALWLCEHLARPPSDAASYLQVNPTAQDPDDEPSEPQVQYSFGSARWLRILMSMADPLRSIVIDSGSAG